MIAALYVETNGVYFGLPDVEPWDRARDARNYAGPHPVIAHPPCERWGRYWSGGPSAKVKRQLGDDGGVFDAALAAVRRFGGVLEHPEGSHAWRAFGLNIPPHTGGWVNADFDGGWTCCVEQGHYGHRARKKTWLYAAGCDLPSLRWGSSGKRDRLDDGFHSAAERRRAIKTGVCQRLSKRERAATPVPFRDLLLSIAQTAVMCAFLAAPAFAGTFFRETETGTVRGTSGSDLIELGHGPGKGIGCGGRDFISGGDDRPLQPWQQVPGPGNDPDDDRLYGDAGPDGECSGSSGDDVLNPAGGDVAFGGLGHDTYVLRGMLYPESAQIDQFNLSRDRLLTVAGARMALVGATVVDQVERADGSRRGRLMALELRAPDYGNVEGSGHWVLVRLATGEQPMVVIPAGGTVLTAPDVERYRRKVLGL